MSDPREIELKSFEIIEGILKDKGLASPEKDVVVRVVHATADPDFADGIVFSEGAVRAGVNALRAGCGIVTDVSMLLAGIVGSLPDGPARVSCLVSDPDAAALSRGNGITRSAAAMRKASSLGRLDGAIVAVGNAPTALYEVIRLIREEGIRPALVVGTPVGFVGAAEAKEALLGLSGTPFITNRGRKGGTPVAAAIINALIRLSRSNL